LHAEREGVAGPIPELAAPTRHAVWPWVLPLDWNADPYNDGHWRFHVDAWRLVANLRSSCATHCAVPVHTNSWNLWPPRSLTPASTMRALHPLADDECIARAQRGDAAAFSKLMARYQDRIYRFLVRLTRSQDDALELTQETFLSAYQALARWRPDARFTTWLFRIARNQAIDWLRRNRRVEFVALDEEQDLRVADPAPTPDATLQTVQRLRALERALARLSTEHREILLLREIEDMSYDDIADVLDISLGAVKSRIARARARLLEKMPG
jgi:RNA polymerase sigma-70 factor (ECF subfamily)